MRPHLYGELAAFGIIQSPKGGAMKKIIVLLFATTLALVLPLTAFANTLSAGTGNALTDQEALSIALKDAGFKSSQVTKIEFEHEGSSIKVEFLKKKTKLDYEYKISKSDGTIAKKEIEYPYKRCSCKAKIGKKAALKKVAKFSGIKYSIVKKAKCKYAYKKRTGKYEVRFRYKGFKHEFELLAHNGKITEWEIERLAA